MKNKCGFHLKKISYGFTLIEMLIASTILLIVVVAALSIYSRSNKSAVDQQMFAEMQNDVRSAIYLISRDVRSAGVGMNSNMAGYFIEGTDGYGPSPESPDSLKIIGNFEYPLSLRIEKIDGENASLVDGELQNMPYNCPGDLENKTVFIASSKCSGAFAWRFIGIGDVSGCTHGKEKIKFKKKASELNPPGGMKDSGWDKDCWDNSTLTFGDVRFYWLDTTGNPGDYPGFNLKVGEKGYLGVPNTLYTTSSPADIVISHQPLAMNIESLQFQYNGDLDQDGTLDGFTNWDNANWTINPGDDDATKQNKMDLISRIQQVRIWVLGRTPRAYIGISRRSSPAAHIFRRPAVANVAAAGADDFFRRFLLESTAVIRNLSLNLYNKGIR